MQPCKMSDRQVPFNIPQDLKIVCNATSLSICWLVTNIWHKASHLLDCLHGSFTAWICLFTVIKDQIPFGDLYSWIRWTQWQRECCQGRLKLSCIPLWWRSHSIGESDQVHLGWLQGTCYHGNMEIAMNTVSEIKEGMYTMNHVRGDKSCDSRQEDFH